MAARSVIKDPPFARYLFDQTDSAWIWLIARVYLGWQWLSSGFGKVTSPAWMAGGTALQGYWTRAVTIPEAPAKPVITYGWYRNFLIGLLEGGHYTWFAKLVAVGEVVIGAALILGLLTGIAAFFGAFMNFNFMLAGTTSTNPVLFTIAVFLILAWKVAGYWGLDRFLLPFVGTPWQPRPGGGGTQTRFEPEERTDQEDRLKPRV